MYKKWHIQHISDTIHTPHFGSSLETLEIVSHKRCPVKLKRAAVVRCESRDTCHESVSITSHVIGLIGSKVILIKGGRSCGEPDIGCLGLIIFRCLHLNSRSRWRRGDVKQPRFVIGYQRSSSTDDDVEGAMSLRRRIPLEGERRNSSPRFDRDISN